MPDFRNIDVGFDGELFKRYVDWHLTNFPYEPIYNPFYQTSYGNDHIIANPTEPKSANHQKASEYLFSLYNKLTSSGDTKYRLRVLKDTSGLEASEAYTSIIQKYLNEKAGIPYCEAHLRKFIRWFKNKFGVDPVYCPLAVDEFATVQVENPNSPDAKKLAESSNLSLQAMYAISKATIQDNINLRIVGVPYKDAYDILENEDSRFESFNEVTQRWRYSVQYNREYIVKCHKWWEQSGINEPFMNYETHTKTLDTIVLADTHTARELRRLYGVDEKFDLLLVGSAATDGNELFTKFGTPITHPTPPKPTIREPDMSTKLDVLGNPLPEAVATQSAAASSGWKDALKGIVTPPTPADLMDTKYVQGLIHGAAGMMALSKFPEIKEKLDWLMGVLNNSMGGAIKNFAKAFIPEELSAMAVQAAPQSDATTKEKSAPTKNRVKAGK